MCSLVLLATVAGVTGIARGQALDPHDIYERRCGRCHAPHAGDFVHDALAISGGEAVARTSGRPLRGLLEVGHGRLSGAEISVIVAHLGDILRSGGLYRDKCRYCHERAVSLARTHLILHDGKLRGRYSGRDISSFLTQHGRLAADEVARMVAVLTRQLRPAGD